jgi:N-acylglucosamine-6-phosphate 2-epimerase
MADISCYEEGIKAEEMGFDIVSTTLSGYTAYTAKYLDQYRPNLELIAKLSTTLKIPVIAEGRIWDPQDAINSLEAGAFAVVIGSAITRPHLITKRFVESISSFSD